MKAPFIDMASIRQSMIQEFGSQGDDPKSRFHRLTRLYSRGEVRLAREAMTDTDWDELEKCSDLLPPGVCSQLGLQKGTTTYAHACAHIREAGTKKIYAEFLKIHRQEIDRANGEEVLA